MQNLMTIVITILPIHQYQYSSRDYAQYSDVLNQLINQGYVAHRIVIATNILQSSSRTG
jgi:hypothetical protein